LNKQTHTHSASATRASTRTFPPSRSHTARWPHVSTLPSGRAPQTRSRPLPSELRLPSQNGAELERRKGRCAAHQRHGVAPHGTHATTWCDWLRLARAGCAVAKPHRGVPSQGQCIPPIARARLGFGAPRRCDALRFLLPLQAVKKTAISQKAQRGRATTVASRSTGASKFPSGGFASGKRDPAATISIVAHAGAMKRPLRRHPRAAPRPARLLSIPPVARHRQGHFRAAD
jgi:hypothetical protein